MFYLHHEYKDNFSEVVPGKGFKIVQRNWDFGTYPSKWAQKINDVWDELWVDTSWLKQNAVRSGIDHNKVHVVPQCGINKVFQPSGPRFEFASDGRFRFLFVGGAVLRKGVDTLLKAYSKAFTPAEKVELVIKDYSTNSFYSKLTLKNQILDLSGSKNTAPIRYIGRFLSAAQLATLYRSCQAAVFPYRSEGFGVPILEAMACGMSVVVPNFGACLDYCSAQNAELLPIRRISLPVRGEYAINSFGFSEAIDEVDFCEVDPDVLGDKLKYLYLHFDDLKYKRILASKMALEEYSWERVTERMVERLVAAHALA
ncbi:MAG: glycosyltransferase [Deltaproteobacteria bacterium]|nr:glycosyltransferase [Deltaproteobacteria bacterium]